ncbi:NACHT, LRR and PYD domains-containing protein 3-like isoform X2 [Mobula hypostoma]|uniref:NACHT, LRR and PYD domains-containing protein 3-like isoform X2 n=1 Tax=Mobula hypostoma TaxID=723540 RepID=UPI002FC2A72A
MDFVWIMQKEKLITSDQCQTFLQELLAKNDPRPSLFDVIIGSDDKEIRHFWKTLLKFQDMDADLRKIMNEISRKEFEENAGSAQENEHHQKDSSQSKNDSKQILDSYQDQPNDQPWTRQHEVHAPSPTGAGVQSPEANRVGNELKENAGSPEENAREVSNEHKLDDDQVQPNSQPWAGQQPATVSERDIAKKADKVQPFSTPGADMELPEENILGKELKENAGSPEENAREVSNEHKLDDDQVQPNSQPWAGQQPATVSERDIAEKADKVQLFSTPGADMELPEENILGKELKENAGSPEENAREVSNEHKQDDDQVQPNSQPWAGQQPATVSERDIAEKADKVQPFSTPGADMELPEENILGKELKENAGSPEENAREVLNEHKLDDDQVQPNSQPWAGQQPATVSERDIAEKADKVQPFSTPGADMELPEENILGKDWYRTNINNADEDRPDALQVLGMQSLEASKTDDDVEQLHKCFLREQSKLWKGTENEGSVLAETRNFDDIYTDLCVIATSRERLFIEHDMMQEENNNQDIQIDFHQLFRSGNSLTDNTSMTVVCGAAGTGKSTMIQKIIHDWSTGTMYKQFKFILHFPLRQLNAIKCKTNLNTLILDAYPHFKSNLEHLWSETNNLLFILDDFDQFAGIGYYQDEVKKGNPQQKCLEPQSVCLVSDIVHSLLQGDLLKGCSLLITTRPWNLETLHEAPIDATFQIIGCTTDQAKQYFNRYFRDGFQGENVIKLIEKSEILRRMCRNPLFCSALCSSLKSQQIQGERTTCAMYNSRVFFAFFALLLDRSGYNVKFSRNSLRTIGELAYKSIGHKKNSFESDKLSDLNFFLPNFASTFIIQVQDNDMTASVYKFTHSFIRDFIAAVSKRLHTKGIELQRILNDTLTFTDDRWVIFSRFLVGLCSEESSDLLEGLLGKCISDVSRCISDWLSETIKSRIGNLEGKFTQNTFLNILHCLSEFGDIQLTKNALTMIPAIKLNQCLLRHSDCTVISTTLSCSETVTEMDLSSCRLQLEVIQQLEPVLHKCEILRLNGNDLRDAGVKFLSEVLKKSDCRVQRLELKSNKLTDDCLEDLFSTLARNRSLTELDLSNSTQQEEEANRFTTDILQNVIQNSDLKQIRLIRSRDFEQNSSKDETALNVLTVITE